MAANQSPFSIRPIKPTGDRKPKTLTEFIARVNATNPGGFRALNQAEVKRQIEENSRKQHGDPDSPDVHMEDGAGSEEEADTEASKDLGAARMEVLRYITFAWHQASHAQQIVSLLMSKEAPTQVIGTLDPELRNKVGIGSLGSTKLHEPPFREQRLQENTLISTGAKLLAINNSANKLLAAATRLQKEMTVETEYWHQVLNIKEGGWPVSRLPNNPLTVAVKFGFTDSSPEFQANSWGALNREDDGSVDLRMPPLVADPKQLVVSMEKNGKILSRSSLPQPLPSDAPLELRVREARDTILAHELWHEMNREARSLLAYNVQLLPASIRYQIDKGTAIIFTLTTLGGVPEMEDGLPSDRRDGYVETICTTLHLLLAYARRQIARKRAHAQPLSLNRGRQQKPVYSLLKPVIAFVQHETWLRSSIKYVSDLTATLRLAGIGAAHFNLEEQPLPQITPQGGAEQLLTALVLQPFVFRIDLSLTPQVRMTMVGITATSPRGPGSLIRFMPPSPKQEARALAEGHGPNVLGVIYQPADVYESLRDAFQYLEGATTRALAKHFEVLAAKWMADAPPAENSPTEWAATIKGDAVRDVDTERRGVAFEVLRTEEHASYGGSSAASAAFAAAVPSVVGLRVLGDQVDLQGGLVHQVFSWSLDDVARGSAEPKERIEDVVQRLLMTAA